MFSSKSQLVRLSIHDMFWYCYLDQDSMDSSFFRLEDSNYFRFDGAPHDS
jgi:hypothetical protein